MTTVFILNNGKVYSMPKSDTYDHALRYVEGAFDTGLFWHKGVGISFDLVDKCVILD